MNKIHPISSPLHALSFRRRRRPPFPRKRNPTFLPLIPPPHTSPTDSLRTPLHQFSRHITSPSPHFSASHRQQPAASSQQHSRTSPNPLTHNLETSNSQNLEAPERKSTTSHQHGTSEGNWGSLKARHSLQNVVGRKKLAFVGAEEWMRGIKKSLDLDLEEKREEKRR